MPPVFWPGCPLTCWPGTSSDGTSLSASCVISQNPRCPPRFNHRSHGSLARSVQRPLTLVPECWLAAPLTCWPGTSSAGTLLSASCVIFKNPRSHGDEVFVSDVGISPNYSGCFRMPWVFNPGCPPPPGKKRREPRGMRGGVPDAPRMPSDAPSYLARIPP